MTLPQVISATVFILSLILIFTEWINRTIAAVLGAAVMGVLGWWFNFYSEKQAILAIDFKTVGLLVGMMVFISILEPTGFFQYLAVWAGRISRGKPVLLLLLLGTITTLLSMFIDNVTTVVLIAPITILICEILGFDPIPYLMAEAILSDTGGAATSIGDPPNVLIASAANLSFNDFLRYSLPIIFVAWLAALALLYYLFRKELAQGTENAKAIMKLDPSEALSDWPSARKALLILGFAIILFFFQEKLELSISFIILSAAAIVLVCVRPDIDQTLKRIEWSVIVFFCALFIIVGGLEASGLLASFSQTIAKAVVLPPKVMGIILIWVVAGMSAIVDNVPITIALIPVINGLGSAGMNIAPLWWALVFGAGLGGNGTIIGSSANIIVVTLSERTRTPITSALWNKRGLPIMVVTCFVASILYAIAFPYFR